MYAIMQKNLEPNILEKVKGEVKLEAIYLRGAPEVKLLNNRDVDRPMPPPSADSRGLKGTGEVWIVTGMVLIRGGL